MKALAGELNVSNLEMRIADMMDEVIGHIENLDPEVSHEQDEMNQLLNLNESIIAAYNVLQDYESDKKKGIYTNQN